jgi:hypothetical protein
MPASKAESAKLLSECMVLRSEASGLPSGRAHDAADGAPDIGIRLATNAFGHAMPCPHYLSQHSAVCAANLVRRAKFANVKQVRYRTPQGHFSDGGSKYAATPGGAGLYTP